MNQQHRFLSTIPGTIRLESFGETGTAGAKESIKWWITGAYMGGKGAEEVVTVNGALGGLSDLNLFDCPSP